MVAGLHGALVLGLELAAVCHAQILAPAVTPMRHVVVLPAVGLRRRWCPTAVSMPSMVSG